MLTFLFLHYQLLLSIPSRRDGISGTHSHVYNTTRFRWFLRGMYVAANLADGGSSPKHIALESAAVSLLIYTVYRITEMAMGIDGPLFQSQILATVIDIALPLLSCVLLVAFHPGIAYGSSWTSTSFLHDRSPLSPRRSLQHAEGYPVHHRYDPKLRSQQTSQKLERLSHRQPGASEPTSRSSPGLPFSPKAHISQSERLTPSLLAGDEHFRAKEPGGHQEDKVMVQSDALW